MFQRGGVRCCSLPDLFSNYRKVSGPYPNSPSADDGFSSIFEDGVDPL